MVLDNADDHSIFFNVDESEKVPLLNFLPQATHGSILFTSRNRLAAQNLAGGPTNLITVEPMNEAESLDLLRSRSVLSQSLEDEKALVRALEYIPLAIIQAGSYIANRSPRITVAKYLQLFHQSDSNQTHLLDHKDAKDLRRDPDIRHAVITTWQLSFEQIYRDQPSAVDLLALMSMFDRHGIPEDLVRRQDDALQFEDALAPLISFSLVREEMKLQSFDMHNLVQLSVRKWLEIHQLLNKWREKAIEIMAQKFPCEDYENWSICQMLLPHAKEVMRHSPLNISDQVKVATIALNCGAYLIYRRNDDEACTMLRGSLIGREKSLGSEHPDTLISASLLGMVLESQGKFDEAEVMHRRAFAGLEKALGPEHPAILATAIHLGLALHRQGKHNEAEAMCRQTTARCRKTFGPEHPYTLSSVSFLNLVLHRQGKSDEAQEIHRREKSHGPENPDTLTNIDESGLVLNRQVKHDEAEVMHRRALAEREKALVPEHPDTLISVSHLGMVLERRGKYDEAEAMYRRHLEASEKTLGPEHPGVITSLSLLGSVLDRQGKFYEAEAMFRRALAGREKAPGAEHRDTLISVSLLGMVLDRQGKFCEAEAMYRRALAGREKALGAEHRDTLISVNLLGIVLDRQGKYCEAEAMCRRTLAGRENKVLCGQENCDAGSTS
jgi:tetratricopeptide (TPR) repeat protein